jgi:hypothetical protein
MHLSAKLAGLTAVAAVALAANAWAEDSKGKKIDCSDTAMSFSAPGFTVTCTDYSNGNVSNGFITTGVRTELLEADADDRQTYLAVVDQRVLGDYAMRRYSIIDDVRSYFNETDFDDWTLVDDFQGFQMANYTGHTDSGSPTDCIAFRREVTRRYNGVGRLVVGIACTLRSRDAALDALKKLDAPGG